MHKHTCGDVRFRTCAYKHTHGHRTNTVHTRETIKVSLAKRNTLYVCSWICTIKSVHVCMSARFRKSVTGRFAHQLMCPIWKVCVNDGVCWAGWLCVPCVHVLAGMVTCFFLDQVPFLVAPPVLSALTILKSRVDGTHNPVRSLEVVGQGGPQSPLILAGPRRRLQK